MSCMYSTQGELLCRETYVSEKPNTSPSAQAKSAPNPIITGALQQNYCDITVTTDPKTGAATYSMKKDCQK